MKRYLFTAAITVLCLGLFSSFPTMNDQVQAASTEQFTVLNPMGTPPPIELNPMAPRLNTIDGKTIYIVNDGYPGSEILCAELEKGFKETYPDTTFVYRDKRGGMRGEDTDLWTEMEEKADAMIIPLGHWSVCAPGVTEQAIEFEKKYQKPAIPVALAEFEEQLTEVAKFRGMPGIRVQYIQGPVWAKTGEQLRKAVVFGNNPLTGKPVMQEIVEKLTRPLSPEDTKTGQIKRDMGPATYTGTAAELQQLYLEKRYTDFMPIILPTEELVDEMLKATSHEPDEPLGRMNPGSGAGETWSYTVKTAAISAVMAGAKPEYFPVILALGSSGQTAINVSDNGFAAGAVINGDIRDEIGLNYEEGAVGPYAHANVAIGRAWNLLSINGGNCGKVGTTYMGTVGNAQNALALIIAENEEKSPFQPLSVRRGFQKGENVITLFSGWGILSAKNWKVNEWASVMDYPKTAKAIHDGQTPGLFGTVLVLSPPIANFIADDGYDTVEKFTEYVTGVSAKPQPKGKSGGFGMGSGFQVIVTGGSNNNYWMAGGLRQGRSITIDEWR